MYDGTLDLRTVQIAFDPQIPQNETSILKKLLKRHSIKIQSGGTNISIGIDNFQLPEISSKYKNEIEKQAYSIKVNEDGIDIQGRSQVAIYYAIQTLDQLIEQHSKIPYIEIVDWPDFAIRMVMLDPARQNENFDYYRKVIEFLSRYKINAILIHLTDDQTSALYHEDYLELMHPHAWKVSDIQELIAFAEKHHIDLIPEIESFGHSRMFTRLNNYSDYLHETDSDKIRLGWTGTAIPGYTNVLCPASDSAMLYLERMYKRADSGFDHPWLHIGFDEVDITRCQKCIGKFGNISPSEWILTHFRQCHVLALQNSEKVALWGDMLLHYSSLLDEIPISNTIIFDWHYGPEVSEKSVKLFTEKGFEVVACPALVCSPHMILPDQQNYLNIDQFSDIARKYDLMGLNTTIWIPTRYLSGSLWTGIAYTATKSWSGSNWDEMEFYRIFLSEFFGSEKGVDFYASWKDLTSIVWHRNEFNISCWIDIDGIERAKKYYYAHVQKVNDYIAELNKIQNNLNQIGTEIGENKCEWMVIERSVKILRYTLEHLKASSDLVNDDGWERKLVQDLDNTCIKQIEWIEQDWNQNRYSDDPNKNGLYLTNQHLLYSFKKMHQFHQQILEGTWD